MLERIDNDLGVIYDRISGAGISCSVHRDTVTEISGHPLVTIQYAYSDFSEDTNRTRIESVNRYKVIIAAPPDAAEGIPDFGTAFKSAMALAQTIARLFLTAKDARRKDGSITITRVDQEPIQRDGIVISGVVMEIIFRYPAEALP